MKVWSMTKFCDKKTFSAKIAIFSLKITQLKIFLCLTQAPNTAIQICRNKGATKKASRKTVYYKVLAKKVTFIKTIVVTLKQSISHHLYIGINVLVYGKCLMVTVWSMTKKSFCFKNAFFAKNVIFSKIMSQSKDFVG